MAELEGGNAVKTVGELLSDLARLGVEFWVDGERLCYRAPKDALTPPILAELRERKGEIQHFLGGGHSRFLRIPRASRDGVLPLAVAQEEFWSLEQLLPGNSFSNIFAAFRLTGPLDLPVFRQTLDEIVRRHEVLRTTFTTIDARAAQIVTSAAAPGLMVQDLSELPLAEREAACLRRIIQDSLQPFDLVHGPLLRVTLLGMAGQEYLLLLTMHHIISDVWSLQVLVSEIGALYESLIEGRPSPLPELSIQYADFAVWQRRLLERDGLRSQLSYWKEQLSNGELAELDLPLDYPRTASPSFQTSRQVVTLPGSLAKALKEVGHEEGCTLFMTLLSILKLALHGVTRQQDISVGTLVGSRNHEQLERMIGLFTNTLLLRTDVGGDPTLRGVLQRVRRTVLEAYDHQDLPFEALVQALERERELKRDALCRVFFVFGSPPPPSLQLGELTMEPLDLGKGLLEATIDLNTVTTFDLILTLTERPEEVTGSVVYKSAFFSSATVSRMLEHFRDVAERIASRPDERVSSLPPFARG